ncbi:MAG: LysM peptidoglycan-binding domain-containing protein [Streptosporangiaceae bacterium]
MRTWTKSACVVLAWSILSITLVAVGMTGSVHPAQVSTRTARSTEVILSSTLSVAAPAMTATSPATKYVVQSGDTLSGVAARFGMRGGWPALYTANLMAIGRDPNALRPGTVLLLPGPVRVRYTVAAGDTLSGIAAGLGVRGGWPALYAANRQAIGQDPNALRPGTVLRVPHPGAPASPPSGVAPRRHPEPPPSSPGSARPHPQRAAAGAPASAGMPQWLKIMLLTLGLLILAALLTEPALAGRRRRQQAVIQASRPGPAGAGRELASPPPAAERACIVLADHDRLVVTYSKRDDTVYVLRPPGEDPRTILRVARLVLPEGPYGELAKQLGMPAVGPVE